MSGDEPIVLVDETVKAEKLGFCTVDLVTLDHNMKLVASWGNMKTLGACSHCQDPTTGVEQHQVIPPALRRCCEPCYRRQHPGER